MFKRMVLSNMVIILFAVILLVPIQLSYADYGSFTVNVPNSQGGYTAIVIKQSGQGFTGPQGEYYSSFPSVFQLQNVYGLGAPSSPVINTYVQPSTDQEDVVTVNSAPPELPQYVQPDPPDSDYIWTPGYWAYSSSIEDYYWVPGTWVTAPADGLLWTPGYWYWRNGEYAFSDGYWGSHIGFYGGINYGHGYEGTGNASFNGGPGGTNAQPTPAEQIAMHEKHIPPTSAQTLHIRTASNNTTLRASFNHGIPAIAATVKPGVFKGQGVVPARKTGAVYHPAANRGKNLPSVQSAKSAQSKAVVKKPKPKAPPKPKIVPKPDSDVQNKQPGQ